LPKAKKVFGHRFSDASTKRLELKESKVPSPSTYDISGLGMCSSQQKFAPYLKNGSQTSLNAEQKDKRFELAPHIKGGTFMKT
jgi:hypothetical protein